MKHVLLPVLLCLAACGKGPAVSTSSAVVAGISADAKIVDMTGLDGCSFLLQLADGKRLEPVNLPASFRTDGLAVHVVYEAVSGASICMAGQLVKVISIEPIAASTPATIVYSKDLRTVDGGLTEVIITPAAGGTFAITLHTNAMDRAHGTVVDQTKPLGFDLACQFAEAQTVCSRDLRPVDGALVEVLITKNASGTYDVTLHTNVVDQMLGHIVDQTTAIADDLVRKAD